MSHGELRMSKEGMSKGFAQGRTLIQEEWAHPKEKQWIEELIQEGKCTASPWEYKDTFQCAMRKITGVKQ